MAGLSYDDYKIGIICALSKERTAVEAMFDGPAHTRLAKKDGDNNEYSSGKIGEHNVVVASLGSDDYGLVSAADVAGDIRRSFRSIKYGFMVGIAGGMPRTSGDRESDVRLGDVVVGSAKGVPSVINYGIGKAGDDGDFDIRSQLAEPPPAITRAVAALQTQHTQQGPTYLRYIAQIVSNRRYNRPQIKDDYYNIPEIPDCLYEVDGETKQERLIDRLARTLRDPPSEVEEAKFVRAREVPEDKFFDYPFVHYGSIASANELIKSRQERNMWYNRILSQTKAKVLCFEMEASGIVKGWPCLAIRGICDYCDSHKNKDWQNFAAATAAAYTKDLLSRITPSEVEIAKSVNEVISQITYNTICLGIFNFGDPGGERQRILQWLAPANDPGVSAQLIRLNKLRKKCKHNNTGKWIHEDLFKPWLNTTRARSLWLHGPVGCGKSVTCSMILDRIQDCLIDRDPPLPSEADVVLFLLFSFDDQASQNFMFVLRFLLFQLSAYGRIPPEVTTMHQTNYTGPSEDDYSATLLKILQRMQSDAPETSKTIDWTHSSYQPYTRARSLTLVIDSIDELSPPDFKAEILQLVLHLQATAVKSPHFPFRLVLCSRKDQDIEDTCKESGEWYITTTSVENIRTDISNSVSSRIRNHLVMKKMTKTTQDMVRRKVTEAAKDMFRLAALYMDQLSKWNMDDPEEDFLGQHLFSKLPKDMDEFYDYIMDRIKPQELRNDMFVILKWILIAARPLTVAELQHACAIAPERKGDFKLHRHLRNFQDRLVGLIIVNQTQSLAASTPENMEAEDVELLPEAQTVSFEHFSVKEYLLRMNARGWPTDNDRFHLKRSQLYASQCCLAYMAHCSQNALGRTQNWPFRKYSWHHWAHHLALWWKGESEAPTDSKLPLLSADSQTEAFSLRIHNNASFPFLNYRQQAQPLPERMLLLAGKVESKQEFDFKFSRLLMDPEFPFDFSQEDLVYSSLKRPMYREDGLPDPHHELVDPSARELELPTSGIRPDFVFPPLASCPQPIRLVALQPSAHKHSPIICSELTDTLYNAPCYRALSYEWCYGEEHDEMILINGGERALRANLASALRQLRQDKLPTILWIDALCIDMGDMADWGGQIRIMDQIYREAEEVIVWLGSEFGYNNQMLEDIAIAVKPNAYRSNEERRIRMMPEHRINELFSHPIWSKLWILLEVCLASRLTVVVGDQRLSWTILGKCADLIERQSETDRPSRSVGFEMPTATEPVRTEKPSFKTFEMYREFRNNYQNKVYPSLLELLFKTRHLAVSNPVDKLQTMRHLLSPREQEEIASLLDHNRSNLEMCILVAEYCLENFNNLDLLSINNPRTEYSDHSGVHGRFPVHRKKNKRWIVKGWDEIPSWIPVWHWEHWDTVLHAGKFDRDTTSRFTAGGQSFSGLFALKGQTLTVRGIKVGRIHHIFRLQMERTVSSAVEHDPALEKALFDRYGGLVGVSEALWSTSWAGSHSPDSTAYLDRASLPYTKHKEMLCDSNTCETLRRVEHRVGFWSVSERYRKQRVVCITQDGHLALVPSWSGEGDEIHVFLGGAVPYVIRKTTGEDYRLIGDCYVHNIMHGELLANGRNIANSIHEVNLV